MNPHTIYNSFTRLRWESFLERIAKEPGYWDSLGEDKKGEWAEAGAVGLVHQIQGDESKRAIWGFWKRVKKAEEIAVKMTRILDSQALYCKCWPLFAYWVRVRQSLKSGSYHG